jgi:CTP synthase (UTP-ammonia lyase)
MTETPPGAIPDEARRRAGADHAEEHPDAEELVVVPLACSLAGQEHPVRVVPGTQAGALYAASESVEPFFCSFGLDPRYLAPLERAGLRFSRFDAAGEARILELPGHPFVLGTLFVPQANPRRSPHPLLAGLVAAAGQRAAVPVAG